MRKASLCNGRTAKRPRTAESTSSESPVHVVVAAPCDSSTSPKAISLDSSHLLEDLLRPLKLQEFMTRDFRHRAVHVKGSTQEYHGENMNDMNGHCGGESKNRFQSIIEEGMQNLDTLELLKETSSESIFVWLAEPNDTKSKPHNNSDQQHSGKDSPPEQTSYPNPLVQSIEISDANAAFSLHKAGGHALYCRAPPVVEQVLVSKLLRETGLGCGQYDPSGESMTSLARGEVEMFITAKAGGVTDWHYDFQENFTLQLSGVKRWTLQRGTVAHPLRACTPHYKAPDVVENQLKAAHLSNPEFIFDQPTLATSDNDPDKIDNNHNGHNAIGPTETVTLHPGDALYFPAGMWHKIEVLEPGVSINVSLMATNYATVTCQALQHLLLQRDEWRQVVVHQPAINDTNLNAIIHLKRLLKNLPEIIQDLEQNLGGANAILPPVLLRPANLTVKSRSDMSIAESNAGEEENSDHPIATSSIEIDGSCDEDSNDENIDEREQATSDQMTVEAEDLGDRIIDACQFEYPAGSSGSCPTVESMIKNRRYVLNPLASLIRLDEVKGYYSRRGGCNFDDEEQQKLLFVLNVNYAGVESHESAIRVIMRDDKENRYLNQLYQITPKGRYPCDGAKLDQITKACPNLIYCLVYHGYFAPVDQTS